MSTFRPRSFAYLAVGAVAVALAGCPKQQLATAEVDGIVRIRGTPAADIYIEFLPDPERGARGPTATAETDGQGRYQLHYVDKKTNDLTPGAAVGWNHVLVRDLLPARAPARKVPPSRVPAVYGEPQSTPLTFEIKPGGKQSFDIDIP